MRYKRECLKCGRIIGSTGVTGLCKSCVQLGTQKSLGFKHTEKAKKAISKARIGELNVNWKGNKVGYDALHQWVKKRIPKPLICPKCKIRPALDLANKGTYDRNLDNWEWLCRKCHMDSDGRMFNLKQFKK